MLELTFGEQVKIVLKRKGMTIKELAELIENHTGKKMSRQNLTQRLSRDNFQEQDMRMIAEILECPISLSILGDTVPAVQGKKAQENPVQREPEAGMQEVRMEEPVYAETEEKRAPVYAETEEKRAPVYAETEEKRAPVYAETDDNERDITIGELLEINEELDAIEAQGEAQREAEREAQREAQREAAEAEAQAHKEELFIEAEEVAEEEELAEEEEVAEAEELVEPEELTKVQEPVEAEDLAEVSAEELIVPEEPAEVEERIEPEEPKPEKVRGWRAYLQRKKKTAPARESKTVQPVPEPAASPRSERVKEEEMYDPELEETAGYYGEEPAEESVYAAEENAYAAEENAYAAEENAYAAEENAYAAEESTYAAEESTYAAEESTYAAEPEEAGYEYADRADPGYPNFDYEYEEEDLEAGDVNPYTGREYESNSVRVHPKRIGYVQVYDRTDHKWTDMTEWAFLGYQERKKALLGKDYEEPIYLD